MGQCRVTVFWWDTAHVTRCIRQEGHFDFHRDGVRWFDSHGYQVPTDIEAELVAVAYSKAGLRTPGEIQ